jgi:alpha-ketoglutaric semialdehyde dehydrogenase
MTAAFTSIIGGDRDEAGDLAGDVNPSDTGDVVGEAVMAGPRQARDAVAAAVAAAPGWAAWTGAARAEVLDRAGAELLDRRAELGDLLAREEGKTLPEAVGEVARAGQIFRYQAAEAVRAGGELIDSVRPGVEVAITREPLGAVAVITPWNFPIAIPAWKIAPALAHGNTVVLKPAELVPASAWQLADILHRAGLPPGVLNLLLGAGAEVGDALTGSPDIAGVSFTGSVATGRRVLAAAQAHQARVQLEMGGKNPLVVADDADLDVAVEVAIQGSFYSTGQRCTASSRLIVMAAVHDEFVAALTAAMRGLVVGDARAAGTQIGPVVSAAQLATDERYLGLARDAGAEVVGGERLGRAAPGYYLAPALILGADNADVCSREEIFGPVASVIRAADYDEAVAISNDTPFGLAAGIVTRSLARASDFRRRSRAGMVMVNLPTAGVDYHVPFGGRQASSYGPREQGSYAREFYTTVKTSYIAAGPA